MRVHDERLRGHRTCHHIGCCLYVWNTIKIFEYSHIISGYTSAFKILHKSGVKDHSFVYIRVQCVVEIIKYFNYLKQRYITAHSHYIYR